MHLGLAAVALLLLFTPRPIVAERADEYQVKAAFLYNFAKFVEWPETIFKSSGEPISICVIGHNPFGPMLKASVNGKTIGERKFVVEDQADVQHAAACRIVFISSSERRRLRSIMARLKGRTILTVGETEGFAEEGGVINFKLVADTVRFEINLEAAEQEQIRISSKLLSVAEAVKRVRKP